MTGADRPAVAPLLDLQGISKSFRRSGGAAVQAVKSVDLTIAQGQTVALVGESGSGKSTLGRIALALMAPDRGRVLLDGAALTGLTGRALRERRTAIQPIFQDPTASFNPRRLVRELLGQALRHLDGAARERRAVELLERVGLRPGRDYLQRYPHELSGGQRQRLAIARAIAMEPRLIIADEPLSGADVSIRGQILNLLAELRRERGVAYLLITHDIGLARAFGHEVAVMCAGEIVERGDPASVLARPSHPYTRRLLAAVPTLPRLA